MKLSGYAKKIGVTYRTAHNHWKKGLLKGYQLPTGAIIIEIDEKQEAKEDVAVLYARVSSSENKSNLVTSFCARLYGLRRSKRKTEKIIAELKREEVN